MAGRLLVLVAVCGLVLGVQQLAAFSVGVLTPSRRQGGAATSSAGAANPGSQAAVVASVLNSRGSAAGLALGALGSWGIVAVVAAARQRRSRVAARVARGAPTLIQVLEQKGLLSRVEGLGLLSKAEAAGLGIDTPEKLGLLKLAEDLSLLSTAETLATSPSTPLLLFTAAGALAGLTYLDITAGADFGFLQWVIAGALGAPAVVLLGAGAVVATVFGGTRRSKNIDFSDKVVTYTPKGFVTKEVSEPLSLLNVVEQKQLLSFAEGNGLLALAASLIKRPLTTTEQLGVLSTLEKSGILSEVESSASDTYGAAKYGVVGLLIVLACLTAPFVTPLPGLLCALLALPGLALVALGVGLALVQPKPKFVR
mmetsp:Transcript_80198/g.186213  ORF Transcript_80198/g.186213 Transcript_80198/m.186213 type:complete len:368 (+) Transcript_80198:72-1175(+)